MSNPESGIRNPGAPAAARKGFDVVAYLKLFRFPLVFTAIADSAAGYVVPNPRNVDWGTVALLAIGSAGLYLFGMALNDIADREKDKVLAPGRVLPSGRLSLTQARWAAILALLASLSSILAIGYTFLIQRLVVWALVVASICAYNLFLKLPPVMGLVRAFNLLLGVSTRMSLVEEGTVEPWVFALVVLPIFVYVSALTYVSTQEDSMPDRTKIGIGAGLMALGALLAAVSLPIWSWMPDGRSAATGAQSVVRQAMDNWHGIVFATVLTAWIARRAWAARDKKGVMLLVRDGVGGIILLDAALVGSFIGLVPALCIASLMIPAAISVAIFKRLA